MAHITYMSSSIFSFEYVYICVYAGTHNSMLVKARKSIQNIISHHTYLFEKESIPKPGAFGFWTRLEAKKPQWSFCLTSLEQEHA